MNPVDDIRPQDRHLQPGKHTAGLLRPAPLLEAGEATEAFRCRGEAGVIARVKKLSAFERGQVFAEHFKRLDAID